MKCKPLVVEDNRQRGSLCNPFERLSDDGAAAVVLEGSISRRAESQRHVGRQCQLLQNLVQFEVPRLKIERFFESRMNDAKLLFGKAPRGTPLGISLGAVGAQFFNPGGELAHLPLRERLVRKDQLTPVVEDSPDVDGP